MFELSDDEWEKDAERLGITGNLLVRLRDFFERLDRFRVGSALSKGELLVASLAAPSQGALQCDGPVLHMVYIFRDHLRNEYCPLFWVDLTRMQLHWHRVGGQRSDQAAIGGGRVGLLARLDEEVTTWLNQEPESEERVSVSE